MRRPRLSKGLVRISALATALLAVAGCGDRSTAGDVSPEQGATLLITRDFGAQTLAEPRVLRVTKGLTAMRQLQAAARTSTSYGGRYVTAIDGRRQDVARGYDWLFYVNGIESQVGATAARLKPGDFVQWDYHRWPDVKLGGATVGAFPRPLDRRGAVLVCRPPRSSACGVARAALRRAGVEVVVARRGAVRVIVGPWRAVAGVPGVPDLNRPAAENGAAVGFETDKGKTRASWIADDGSEAGRLGPGEGIIAARAVGQKLWWSVVGIDEAGARRAAESLRAPLLRGLFIARVARGGVFGLPVSSDPGVARQATPRGG